jgi:hypothetical protein
MHGRARRATSMLAPQPIPVSLLEGGAARFFAGAGEAEDEVWPFTSKVWAALVVVTIRTASRTHPLKTKLLNAEPPNADCTIFSLPGLLAGRLVG